MAIEWRENMATGLSVVDNDHKNLFILINQFIELVESSKDKALKEVTAEVEQSFYLIHDYTKTHFKREEMIMRAINYPNLKKHIILHQDLIKQLLSTYKTFKRERETGSVDASIAKLSKILNSWIVDHVIKEDLQFKPYAKNHLS